MSSQHVPANMARFWKPEPQHELSFFKASFTTFTFDRHAHEDYALGVIERGVQKFCHKGTKYHAPSFSIITVNPDEVHDGASHTEEGYQYRMVYVGLPYLQHSFEELFQGRELRAFSNPVTTDPQLGRRFAATLQEVERSPERTDELLLPVFYDLFARHASPDMPGTPGGSLPDNRAGVYRAVERIHRDISANPTLDELAAESGLSRFHFLRVFKEATGLSPHAYVLRKRVAFAKQALEQGHAPSEAALMAGFADQSHLTRRFKAIYALTPGAYIKSL